MISNKFLYSVLAGLLAFFLLVLLVLPNLNVKAKNDSLSYDTVLFNQKKVATVNIEIDEEEWADILANPTKEGYKKATVTINGKRLESVGIRTKGNSSLTSVANSDSDRYSLKIDFDHYDSTQSFYGLKKLNLNNNFSDTTQMKEYVSYEILDSIGVSTPDHSYMYVTINGKDYGLMLGVEQIDETFLAKNFGSNNGYLFKPDGTGSDLKYISSNVKDYTGLNPKTNTANINQSNIVKMIKAINEGKDVETYIDVDNMLRYFAATTALVSMDSYQGTFKHNYYLYEESGKFSIIPWDYNMAFGGFGIGEEGKGMGIPGEMEGMKPPEGMDKIKPPSGQEMPGKSNGGNKLDDMSNKELMTEESINFDIYNPVSGVSLEDRPLLNALLSNKKYLAKYERYLKEISTTYLNEANVSKITEQIAATILSYVEADPSKFGTTQDFLNGVSGANSLPAFASARSESILKQLSGELVIEKQKDADENKKSNEMTGKMNARENMAGNMGGKKPPEGFNPDRMPGAMDKEKMDGTEHSSTVKSLSITIGSLFIMLIFIFIISKFKRRGGFR